MDSLCLYIFTVFLGNNFKEILLLLKFNYLVTYHESEGAQLWLNFNPYFWKHGTKPEVLYAEKEKFKSDC